MVNLTPPQKEIVLALIEIYEQKKSFVKSKEIALKIRKGEGTIRNIMPTLRALGLIESIPGPKGGYLPTNKAYEYFNIPEQYRSVNVPIHKKNGEYTGTFVTDIIFKSVYSPDFCQAIIKTIGEVSKLNIGEEIIIGPTSSGRMIIEGKIIGRDELHGELLLEVINIVSIPRESVKNIMSKRLVYLTPEMSIKDAASIIYKEFIRAAPIIDGNNLIGLLTSSDIARCLSEGKLNITVKEAASRKPVTINLNDDILEAMNRMRRSSIGRLIVIDQDGKPVGIITRTDLLSRIIKPFEMMSTKQS
ncbi:MAG: CBS domain-containing protein [Candidatus Methanomethyliaceae archaeon]|nr:CBS domain-containing protein [Candidatus Methanomethyliaceae archaeon]MDW7971079.1 CBS domain-containing protein [Nitrososphaerota archaeon]